MEEFASLIITVAQVLDGVGVAVIVLGLVIAVVRFAVALRHTEEPYRQLRQDMGRGILLGLEFLVAADIIRTVGVTPTLQGVMVLGLIVLIRTFLSLALEVEIEGKWPWHARNQPGANAVASPASTKT